MMSMVEAAKLVIIIEVSLPRLSLGGSELRFAKLVTTSSDSTCLDIDKH
jgi:hypothetical protein